MDEGSCQDAASPKSTRRSLSEFYAGERFPAPESSEGALIYDAALSLRGWGPAAFREATPDFLDAARWSVLLERLMPIYQSAQARLTEPLPSDPNAKGDAMRVKLAAREFTAQWAPLLFPDDDDG